MRILFANATRDWGGEKSWALDTALCMQRRGHACAMVGRAGDRWVEECARQGLAAHGVRFGPAIFNPVGIANVLSVARAHRPDCITVNISRDMCAGAVAAALLDIPVIRHVGLAEDLNHDPIDWLLHRHWLAGTVAVGHEMKRKMLADYAWLAAESVEVIHIGKDTRTFRPGDGTAARQSWGLPEEAFLFGVTSQLETKKGHALLLDALARLGEERVHLAIAGEGPERDALADRAAELGVAKRVHWLGFTRKLPEFLRCLDAFVLPSLSEGFPNTLVEAMATGLPCIATHLCSIPEVVEHGRSGLLVEPGDTEVLAAAIETVCSDPSLRCALGTVARARVEESFSLESATRRFEAYLLSVVDRRARRAKRRGPA